MVKKRDSSCVKSKIVEIQLENEVGLRKCRFINLSVKILLYLVIILFYLVRQLWKNRITGREVEGRGASDYSFAVNLFCVTWDRENVLLPYAY